MGKRKTFLWITAAWFGGKLLDLLWDLLSAPLIARVQRASEDHEWLENLAERVSDIELPDQIIIAANFIFGPAGLAFLCGAAMFAFWDPISGLWYRFKSKNELVTLSVTPSENLEEVAGRDFTGETVNLDGRKFVRCKFHNSTLIHKGDNFQLVDFQMPTPPGHLQLVLDHGGIHQLIRLLRILSDGGHIEGMDFLRTKGK